MRSCSLWCSGVGLVEDAREGERFEVCRVGTGGVMVSGWWWFGLVLLWSLWCWWWWCRGGGLSWEERVGRPVSNYIEALCDLVFEEFNNVRAHPCFT